MSQQEHNRKDQKSCCSHRGKDIPDSFPLFAFPGYRAALDGKAIRKQDMTTKADVIAMYLALVFDLNYRISFELLEKAVAAARKMGVEMPVGPVYSSDIFYDETEPKPAEALRKLGVLCVEMEAYALYLNAALAGKNALALLTISDNPFTGEGLDAEQRQNTFTQMMEIALEIA